MIPTFVEEVKRLEKILRSKCCQRAQHKKTTHTPSHSQPQQKKKTKHEHHLFPMTSCCPRVATVTPLLFATLLLSILSSHSCHAVARAAPSNAATFLRAASSGNVEEVRSFLSPRSVNINAQDDHGIFALLLAANSGNEEMVTVLLDAKVNVETKDNEGYTALMQAALKGHANVLQLLIDAGADVNVRDNNSLTPLITAVVNDKNQSHNEVVSLLIQANADIRAETNEGGTALMLAATGSHIWIETKLLLAEALVMANEQQNANIERKLADL